MMFMIKPTAVFFLLYGSLSASSAFTPTSLLPRRSLLATTTNTATNTATTASSGDITSTALHAGRDMKSLTDWASENSFQISPFINLSSSNTDVYDDDGNDYGVTFDKQQMQQEQGSSNTILSVPKTFIFGPETILPNNGMLLFDQSGEVYH